MLASGNRVLPVHRANFAPEGTSGGDSGSQQPGKEGDQDCGLAQSGILCDREHCCPVTFEDQSSLDADGLVEKGVIMGAGTLKTAGRSSAELQWEQTASIKSGFLKHMRHEVRLQVFLTLKCCMHEGLLCITLERLEGQIFSIDGGLGLSLESILINIDATIDGQVVVVRMQDPAPMICSKAGVKQGFAVRGGYWQEPKGSASSASQSAKVAFDTFTRTPLVPIPAGSTLVLTTFQPGHSPLSTAAGQSFEVRRNVEAAVFCNESTSSCALPHWVVLLDSGSISGDELDLKCQVTARWSTVPRVLCKNGKMKVKAGRRASYSMLFTKMAHLKGSFR